jgi:hypothetical protein
MNRHDVLSSTLITAGYGPACSGGFDAGGAGYTQWSQLQTTAAMQTANNPLLAHNGQLVANNPIDQAIAECRAWNNNSGAYAGKNPTGVQWGLKVRVAAGISSPAWVGNDVRVGKFYAESNQGFAVTNGTCPCFWTTQFGVYYSALEAVLVREYDSVPEVLEIVMARCTTVFTEPMIRQQIADSTYVAHANAAGFSYAATDTQVSIMLGLGYTNEASGSQRQVTDGVLNSTTTVTSATAAFVVGDVGSYIIGPGIPFGTTIASRTNATTVILSTPAVLSLTSGTLTIMNTGAPSDQQQQLNDLSRRVVGGGTWAAPTGWANTRFGYAFNPYAILPGSGHDNAFTLMAIQHAFAVGGAQFSGENNSGDPSLYPPNAGQYPQMFAAMGALGTINSEQTATSNKFSGVGLGGNTTLATIAASAPSTLARTIAHAAITQNAGSIELPSGFQTMLSPADCALLSSLLPTASVVTGSGTIRQRVPFKTSAAATSQNIPHAATLAGSTIVIHVYGRATVTPTLSVVGGGAFVARKTTPTSGGGTHLACDDLGASALLANALTVDSTQSGSICGWMYELVGSGITYEGGTAAAPGASTAPFASYTTTAANDIVISSVGWNTTTVTGSAFEIGYTNDAPQNGVAAGGNGSWLGAGTIPSAHLGVQSYGCTLSGSQWWAAVLTAYRVAGGGNPPGQPTGVVGTPGNLQATVTFTAPYNGGSPITSTLIQTYLAGVHQAGLDQTITGTGTSQVVTGETNGTAYTSSATCANTNGAGPESAQSAPYTPLSPITAPVTPAAPTGIPLDSEMVWAWVAPDNGGALIDMFEFTETIVGGASLTPVVINDGPPPSTTYDDTTNVSNAVAYTGTVRAHNSQGWSLMSAASAQYMPNAAPVQSTVTTVYPPTAHPAISAKYAALLLSGKGS